MTAKNIDNAFFIIHLVIVFMLYDNSKMYKYAITICNWQVQFNND